MTESIAQQLRDICGSYPSFSGAKLYKKINQNIKHEMPELFAAAQFIAQTEEYTVCRRMRTIHYYCFDYSAAEFTDDQQLKIALLKEKGLDISDPWIGRAPSKDELLVTLMLRMASIMEVDISKVVDAT